MKLFWMPSRIQMNEFNWPKMLGAIFQLAELTANYRSIFASILIVNHNQCAGNWKNETWKMKNELKHENMKISTMRVTSASVRRQSLPWILNAFLFRGKLKNASQRSRDISIYNMHMYIRVSMWRLPNFDANGVASSSSSWFGAWRSQGKTKINKKGGSHFNGNSHFNLY